MSCRSLTLNISIRRGNMPVVILTGAYLPTDTPGAACQKARTAALYCLRQRYGCEYWLPRRCLGHAANLANKCSLDAPRCHKSLPPQPVHQAGPGDFGTAWRYLALYYSNPQSFDSQPCQCTHLSPTADPHAPTLAHYSKAGINRCANHITAYAKSQFVARILNSCTPQT